MVIFSNVPTDQIQGNPYQNLSRLLCRNLQDDIKIHMESQGTQNSWNKFQKRIINLDIYFTVSKHATKLQ